MKRTAAIAAAAFAALGGSAWAASSAAPAAAASSRADVSFEGVHLWVFQGSRLRSVGRASSVTYDRSAGIARAAEPVGDFLGARPEAAPVHVTAGSAEGHLAGRILLARDGVTAARQDGTASTEAARYDGVRRAASGTDPVQVATSRFHVQGQGGFHLDTVSQVLDLDGPVNAQGEVQQ